MVDFKYKFIPNSKIIYTGYAEREDKNLTTQAPFFLRRSELALTVRCLLCDEGSAHILIARKPADDNQKTENEIMLQAVLDGTTPVLPLFSGKSLAYYNISPVGEIFESTDVRPILYMLLPGAVSGSEDNPIIYTIEKHGDEDNPALETAETAEADEADEADETDETDETESLETIDEGDENFDSVDEESLGCYKATFSSPEIIFSFPNEEGQNIETSITSHGYFIFDCDNGIILEIEHFLQLITFDGIETIETLEKSSFKFDGFYS